MTMPVAVDANILARLLLQDDAAQHKKAKAIFEANTHLTAPVTVVLELVWVLESKDIAPLAIASALFALSALPNFKPERLDALLTALRNYQSGMGFADAMHLALSEKGQKFMTFDKAFVKRAKKLGATPGVFLA